MTTFLFSVHSELLSASYSSYLLVPAIHFFPIFHSHNLWATSPPYPFLCPYQNSVFTPLLSCPKYKTQFYRWKPPAFLYDYVLMCSHLQKNNAGRTLFTPGSWSCSLFRAHIVNWNLMDKMQLLNHGHWDMLDQTGSLSCLASLPLLVQKHTVSLVMFNGSR